MGHWWTVSGRWDSGTKLDKRDGVQVGEGEREIERRHGEGEQRFDGVTADTCRAVESGHSTERAS